MDLDNLTTKEGKTRQQMATYYSLEFSEHSVLSTNNPWLIASVLRAIFRQLIFNIVIELAIGAGEIHYN